MSSRRDCLDLIRLNTTHPEQINISNERNPHAGLWLDKYIEDQKRDETKSQLVNQVSALPIPEAYYAFYQRWEKMLEDFGAQRRRAEVKGRMVIGLGVESVLETSVLLHRTYGVPYIPGSALKGLAANFARHRLSEAWQEDSEAYKVVFGNTDDAGYITFFDALYIPEADNRRKVLYSDVITVHHQKYYQGTNNAPADWDSPIPVPFLSTTGKYLIALAAPQLQRANIWISRTFVILEHALATMGIGAKTSSGYGRMKLDLPSVDPEMQKAERYKREIDGMSHREVANQIHGYYQKWQQIKSNEGRILVARAIIGKVRQAGREKASAEKAWYKELLEFLGEE